MTQNQIAYQQNLIKAREAAVKENEQKLKTSAHLHDYGHIRVPMAGSEVQYGGKDWGVVPIKSASEVWANVAKAVSPLSGLFK